MRMIAGRLSWFCGGVQTIYPRPVVEPDGPYGARLGLSAIEWDLLQAATGYAH